MMSKMFGASLAGTTRGGHHGFDCCAVSLIMPPNLMSGAGSCLPLIVVVALGEPGVPVVCRASCPLADFFWAAPWAWATGSVGSVGCGFAKASSCPLLAPSEQHGSTAPACDPSTFSTVDDTLGVPPSTCAVAWIRLDAAT